jgi:hypothetical protein
MGTRPDFPVSDGIANSATMDHTTKTHRISRHEECVS